MSGILNNFMANLQPIQAGGFNPVLDSKYADLGGLEMLNQSRDAIARSKVEDMIRQAQSEGRDLNQYEAGLISRVSPNATAGYNNNLNTQSTLKSNEITQGVNKQKLESQLITDIANKLESTDDPMQKQIYYEQFKRNATQAGIHDETDPQEYSPEAEDRLIEIRNTTLQQARDARSYGGSPAPLQVSNAIRKALDAGDLPTANAIALSAKIFDKGQEFKDANGTIGNIEGYVPSVQDKAFSTGYGTQSGKDNAFAGQGMKNEQAKQDIENKGKIDTELKVSQNAPLPAPVIKLIKETKDGINTTTQLVVKGIDLHDKIKDGTLNLGMFKNMTSEIANKLGNSTPESREYNNLVSYVAELTNNKLLLQKGVQAKDDADRAGKAILNNLNDTELVKERLAYLIKINDDLILEQEKSLDDILKQSNKSPDAYKPQTTQQPQQSNQDFNVDDLVNKYGNM